MAARLRSTIAAGAQRPHVIEFEDQLLLAVFDNGIGRPVFHSKSYPAEFVADLQLRSGGECIWIEWLSGGGFVR